MPLTAMTGPLGVLTASGAPLGVLTASDVAGSAGAVTVLGLLDESGAAIVDESGAFILLENGT